MRAILHGMAVIVILFASWALPPGRAQAANLDTTADRVFGQPDFTHKDAVVPPTANSLLNPYRMALDAHGNLFVADFGNHRVLEYDAPLTDGMAASRVFGQGGSFTSRDTNKGGISANSLKSPMGVALDKGGNLYVADSGNHRVLEYDTPLTTDTTADNVFGQPDFSTNLANRGVVTPSASSLYQPAAVALDQRGWLYVADTFNNRVVVYFPRSVGAAELVFGQADFTTGAVNRGGTVSQSSQWWPGDVALDAAGNLYVADTANHRVLEYGAPLYSTGPASRVFGQSNFTTNWANRGIVTPTASSLSAPYGLALDAQGDLYVGDWGNNRVLEYDAPLTTGMAADRVFGQSNYTSKLANGGAGTPSASSLDGPRGVALDGAGNLYVADTDNYRVLEYDLPMRYGLPTVSALSPSSVAAGSPAFTLTVNGTGFVAGSVVRWNGGNRPTTFLSTTQLNAAISAADLAGGGPFAVTVFTPSPGGGTSSLTNLPLYTRAGHDVTADMVQGQPNFAGLVTINPLLPGAGQLNSPGGVAVDGQSGRLFVADTNNHRVLSWPNAAALVNAQPADLVLGQPNFYVTAENSRGLSAKSLLFPQQLALDRQGNLYVADYGNQRVLEYDAPLSTGMAASRVFGQGGSFTTALVNNGGISANSLNYPQGVALDAQGNLYVADGYNHRVLEYDTPLTTDTTADNVFGQADFSTNLANRGVVTPSANSLSLAIHVALDAQGNLYVSDHNNNRVLEYDQPLTTDRTADRVFGQPAFNVNAANNGGVSANSLDGPLGVAVDGWGNLYVADWKNNRVLEYDRPLATDRTADHVFGQPDSTSNTPGGISANSLYGPRAVAVDPWGNLYVADRDNSRVVEYDWALAKMALPIVRR